MTLKLMPSDRSEEERKRIEETVRLLEENGWMNLLVYFDDGSKLLSKHPHRNAGDASGIPTP